MLPKRRFWTVEKHVGKTFCKNFSSLLAQIEYLWVWKVLTKALTHVFFDGPKSSFGEHNFPNYFNHDSWFTTLCSPNEDFGRLNKALRMHFWTSFQSVVAQNEYSHPWKVLQKRTRNALFIRPKSSFGEHEFITTNCGWNLSEIYAPQTKIWEGRANIRERIFKALFKWK